MLYRGEEWRQDNRFRFLTRDKHSGRMSAAFRPKRTYVRERFPIDGRKTGGLRKLRL